MSPEAQKIREQMTLPRMTKAEMIQLSADPRCLDRAQIRAASANVHPEDYAFFMDCVTVRHLLNAAPVAEPWEQAMEKAALCAEQMGVCLKDFEMVEADEAIHYAESTSEKCNSCLMILSEKNITLALEDAGDDVTTDELVFFCPSYTDATGCRGYAVADRNEMAYWRTA